MLAGERRTHAMNAKTRRRQVNTALATSDRRCLFCLGHDGPFTGEEHVIPRSLGPDTDRFVIAPGVVCDRCNSFLGHQVDAPFVERFDMRLTRRLEGLRGRAGGVPAVIEGRDPIAQLDIDLDGATVTLMAARADETEDGGLDIEIRPVQRDPDDVVSRTIRALWKIALGVAYLGRGSEALDPRFDHLRRAVLGAPFKGFLLQRVFVVTITRRLAVDVSLDTPGDPWAVRFALGGVALAVALEDGARVTRAQARQAGWEVHPTGSKASQSVLLRLEPS